MHGLDDIEDEKGGKYERLAAQGSLLSFTQSEFSNRRILEWEIKRQGGKETVKKPSDSL